MKSILSWRLIIDDIIARVYVRSRIVARVVGRREWNIHLCSDTSCELVEAIVAEYFTRPDIEVRNELPNAVLS